MAAVTRRVVDRHWYYVGARGRPSCSVCRRRRALGWVVVRDREGTHTVQLCGRCQWQDAGGGTEQLRLPLWRVEG